MSPASRRAGRVQRWLRAPLLHFFLIGGLLYAAGAAMRPEPETWIRVTSTDLASMEQDWRRSTGRAPDATELDRLIAQFVDEAILVRKARQLGWDRDDSVIQYRLIRNLRFLDPETERSDAELLEEAYAMGMDQSDIVVRRRLVERMKLAIASNARANEPVESELRAYWEAHPADFERAAQVRISHVFLSRDSRGADVQEDARRLLSQLRAESAMPEGAAEHGDPFLISPHLPLLSERRLAERLGAGFARSVFEETTIGSWTGPIDSSYGSHLVWTHERQPASVAPLDDVRVRVRAAILRERERRLLRKTLAELRESVRVEVEGKGKGAVRAEVREQVQVDEPIGREVE